MIAHTQFDRRHLGVVATALLAACAGTTTTTASPSTTAAQVAGIVWGDPTAIVEPMDGWTAGACMGDAPLICITGPSGETGLVELLRFPLGANNLDGLAADFVASIAADRAQGCGADYDVEPIAASPAVVAHRPGLRFGFVGRTGNGAISERNVQHAFVEGDEVVLLTAAAYAEDGCPGRDDLDSFEPAALEAFDPGLSALVAELTLPESR